MSELYGALAKVYEAMYHSFIDYQAEFECYGGFLSKYHKTQVLEIGSGTGNLATYFVNNGFDYQGMDLSMDMIRIAQKKNPKIHFFQEDMRDFKLADSVESIIITGRTVSYLVTNQDIQSALKCMSESLRKNGLLCFDFIDATRFIPCLDPLKEIVHTAMNQGEEFIRKSNWSAHLENGMDFRWKAVYYKKEKDELINIGTDDSVVRTFTVQELEIFLKIHGFKIVALLDKAAYAFPTYVVVAQKK